MIDVKLSHAMKAEAGRVIIHDKMICFKRDLSI